MNRRYFLQTAATSLSICGMAPAQARRKILLVCLDGFGPEYMAQSEMPNLKRMAAEGMSVMGRCVIPSVTNVNNASIATATLPEEHGITTNYYYNRANGSAQYMESSEFLLRPTIFERAKKLGLKSALVTSKGKLLTLINRGADVAVAAESPGAEFIAKIGPKEDMYSADVNYWSFKTARYLLKERGIDLLFLSTTDYMMHTYPPADERSQKHLRTLDCLLADMVDDHPNLEIYLSADHGMNAKPDGVDIGRVLSAKGIEAETVPIVKDKHVVHHGNLGGACYVYLKKITDLAKAMDTVRRVEGVEEVLTNADAARRFHLLAGRIGDLFVLGRKETAFGELGGEREATKVRTHGSLHEEAVPIVCYGRKVDPAQYKMNFDISRRLVWPV